MEAGRRDRRIRIEYQGPEVDDGLRSKPGGWLLFSRRWAQFVPLTGSERMAAAENAGSRTLKFRFRKPKSKGPITTAMRLIYREAFHDIISVLDLERDEVEVMCVGRSDADPDSQSDGVD